MPDMLFILLLALVVLGPGKLPEFARRLGYYRAKLKQMQQNFVEDMESAMKNVSRATGRPRLSADC